MKYAKDERKKHAKGKPFRGSQVIFGERRHLEQVLESVGRGRGPSEVRRAETRLLKKLIQARTAELNSINPAWDRKFARANSPSTGVKELMRMGARLPQEDYLLARALSEHPAAPAALLEGLADHPYAAVRESVARHPRTPARVLDRLAKNPREPLWFLVACNPSAPPELSGRLRERLRHLARD